MRTETALRMVRDRERVLVEILEDERSQGAPAPFDWRAWRLNRARLVSQLRSRTYWTGKNPRPQAVENLGTGPSRS